MSRVEFCKWRMTGGDYSTKHKMYGAKFILKLVKNLCFWLFSHWYGRLGRNIGGVLSTPETSNKVSQAAASNKRSAENNSAEGENCDKQRCVFRGNDRTRTQILLKFNWKFSQQWKAAIRSSNILRTKKWREQLLKQNLRKFYYKNES